MKHEITTISYTPAQIDLIKRTIAKGATDDELSLFIGQCKRTGLDPFSRQIYSIQRQSWDAATRTMVSSMTTQTSIDGFRVIAQRSGVYKGQLGPFWCGEDGVWRDCWLDDAPPKAAKVGAIRSDFSEPLWGVAKFDSYAAKNKEGKLMSLWAKMPEVMIAKCAEAQALRKAFPNDLSDIYTEEEMRQSENKELKIATVTGEVQKSRPKWSPEQSKEYGEIRQEIVSIDSIADQEVLALNSRMKYDQPSDVIDAMRNLLAKWRDIQDQKTNEAASPANNQG